MIPFLKFCAWFPKEYNVLDYDERVADDLFDA